ncbi:MAB_1171c family putative transporter [Streptosporangium jomthongense]|uniref:MAB_1171c family putative transporter n=1 Tax=Streptosporangium jomthongense TaxID=1193683 RepID=A0ABV8F865_9ACTN
MAVSISFVLSVITLVVFAILTIKVIQVRRAPEDLPLRAVTAGVGCLFLSVFVNLPGVRTALDGVRLGAPKLFVNLITLLGTYFVLAFFFYSIYGQNAIRRMRRERVLLLLTCGVLVTTWFIASPTVREAPADLRNGYDLQARIFLITALAYMTYTLTRSLELVRKYTRAAAGRHVRLGMRIFHASLHLLIAGAFLKIAVLLLQGLGTTVDSPLLQIPNTGYLLLVGIGIAGFALGLGYPLAAGMILEIPVRARHRGLYRQLEPLWLVLHEEFPDLSLTASKTSRWREVLRWQSVHRSYYRRVIEIRDGLVLLAPYYDHEVARQAQTAGAGKGLSGSELESFVQANLIVHALKAKASGSQSRHADLISLNGGHNLDSDSEWLAGLSGWVQRLTRESTS